SPRRRRNRRRRSPRRRRRRRTGSRHAVVFVVPALAGRSDRRPAKAGTTNTHQSAAAGPQRPAAARPFALTPGADRSIITSITVTEFRRAGVTGAGGRSAASRLVRAPPAGAGAPPS